jgi:hypothetical protein
MKLNRQGVLRAVLTAAGVLVAVAPAAVQAQVPGPHPAYLHSLSDLRAALSGRWLFIRAGAA